MEKSLNFLIFVSSKMISQSLYKCKIRNDMENFTIKIDTEEEMNEILDYLESIDLAPEEYVVGTYMPDSYGRSELNFESPYDSNDDIKGFSFVKTEDKDWIEKYKHNYVGNISVGFSTRNDFEQGDIFALLVKKRHYKKAIQEFIKI